MSWNDGIQNAVITSADITTADHGLLDAWLMLDYGNSGQGFGGYCLYQPFSEYREKSHPGSFENQWNYAGHYLWRVMEIAEVQHWKDLVGKTIRVRIEQGVIKAVGHIVKEDWFCPSEDFQIYRPKTEVA